MRASTSPSPRYTTIIASFDVTRSLIRRSVALRYHEQRCDIPHKVSARHDLQKPGCFLHKPCRRAAPSGWHLCSTDRAGGMDHQQQSCSRSFECNLPPCSQPPTGGLPQARGVRAERDRDGGVDQQRRRLRRLPQTARRGRGRRQGGCHCSRCIVTFHRLAATLPRSMCRLAWTRPPTRCALDRQAGPVQITPGLKWASSTPCGGKVQALGSRNRAP